jgi:hypothetical protein
MRMPAPSPVDLEAVGHHLVGLTAVEVGDEAHAAGVVLEGRVIEALFRR